MIENKTFFALRISVSHPKFCLKMIQIFRDKKVKNLPKGSEMRSSREIAHFLTRFSVGMSTLSKEKKVCVNFNPAGIKSWRQRCS